MKADIRKEMLKKRDEHHSKGGHQNCLIIMDSLLRLIEFREAKCVLLYASKGSEVHTDGIIRSALSLGKRVVLPVTKKEEKKLVLYEIHSMEELAPGAFGIMEPQENEARRVEPEDIDLAVVPGVSFDKRGHRIGYGMGYYDALLPKIGGKKIGIAYGFQIVERVPEDPHDIAVDMIVTEEKTIECAKDACRTMPVAENGGGADGSGKDACTERSGSKNKEIGKRHPFRVAVLASGRGSDFQSLIDAVKEGKLQAELVALITENSDAKAIERANEAGIPHFIIPHTNREELDDMIKKKLDEIAPDLVVLAGYMKIIKGNELLSEYKGRIINIHPSLLPKYPGAHAQRDAFEAGEKISGYTIHFVDATLDGGPIIFQEKVGIEGCKSADEAAERILEREHIGLPAVVQKFAEGQAKQGHRLAHL